MQDTDGPASPVIDQPTHDHPHNLTGNVQLGRLTDSHRRRGNPNRGFELMKTAFRLFRIGAERAEMLAQR
jgi:hypothetical protein